MTPEQSAPSQEEGQRVTQWIRHWFGILKVCRRFRGLSEDEDHPSFELEQTHAKADPLSNTVSPSLREGMHSMRLEIATKATGRLMMNQPGYATSVAALASRGSVPHRNSLQPVEHAPPRFQGTSSPAQTTEESAIPSAGPRFTTPVYSTAALDDTGEDSGGDGADGDSTEGSFANAESHMLSHALLARELEARVTARTQSRFKGVRRRLRRFSW
jgi:hypothetical protein|mmetsp:Transcript_46617/g.105098  ORF Transcript_46617/g.105098 Transcript_46617/m.105098 type:complete len:215 (+) Transcript_46617:326-970(+)